MTAAALKVENLCSGYGRTQIVSNVSFEVPAGDKLTILGRNGVGKTTLMASLMGLSTRHNGAISINDLDVTRLKTTDRSRQGLGYVPQTRDIFPSLTVEENLLTGLKRRKRDAIAEAYEMFPHLAQRKGNLGKDLSGGEQQMLCMARTLLGQPTILLLDEPLEGLAPVICDQIMETISHLAESNAMTIILVEQQIERALDFAERAIVVERGRIAWEGPTAALRADRSLTEQLLGVGIH